MSSRRGSAFTPTSRRVSYEDSFIATQFSQTAGPAGRRPHSALQSILPRPAATGPDDLFEHSAPLKLADEVKSHEEKNGAPPERSVHPAVAPVAALLALSAVVLVGTALTITPEYHEDVDQAANLLGTVNGLVKKLWVEPLTIPWVDESLRSRGLTPPPPPPAPDCINATEELRALDAFDRFAKDQVAEGAAVVSALDLHWSYAGALFFMFTLQTTIGYGTFVPSTHAGMWAVILLGMVSVSITAMCLGVYIDTLDTCVEWLAGCCVRSGTPAGRLLAHKLLISLSLLLAYMALMAWFVSSWKGYLSNGMDFNDGVYMAFQTVSTVGLGDVSLARGSRSRTAAPQFISRSPAGRLRAAAQSSDCHDSRCLRQATLTNRSYTLSDVFCQFAVILPGLIFFGEAANVADEALKSVINHITQRCFPLHVLIEPEKRASVQKELDDVFTSPPPSPPTSPPPPPSSPPGSARASEGEHSHETDMAKQHRIARSEAISFGKRHIVALVTIVLMALIGAKVFEDCEKNAGEPQHASRVSFPMTELFA